MGWGLANRIAGKSGSFTSSLTFLYPAGGDIEAALAALAEIAIASPSRDSGQSPSPAVADVDFGIG